MADLSKNSISIAGEFAVLSQLALRGIDANMTLGNTKSVDILAANSVSGNVYRIEVKTSLDRKSSTSKIFGRFLGWVMGEKNEGVEDDNLFYIFVNFEKKTSVPRFFVIPSRIVAKYVKREHQFWIDNKQQEGKSVATTSIRLFRIGLDDSKYDIDTPLAKDYENRWDFIS